MSEPCKVTHERCLDTCLRCLHQRRMHDDQGCILCWLRHLNKPKTANQDQLDQERMDDEHG